MKKMYLDVLIADDIRSGIESNRYPENSKLPSEQQLCEMYHVQKMTIRSSLQILKDEGRIYSKNKSGYYVQKRRIVKNLRYFRSTTSLVESMGKENESLLLKFRKIPSDKRVSQLMNINIGTDLYCLERLRKVDNAPVSLECNYIIAGYFPGLEAFDLSSRSLYRIYEEEYQVCIDRAQMQLSVVDADGQKAELLEVSEGDALIKEDGMTYDYTNRFVEFTENFMRIDRFQFIK
ncbi:MAG: GntR family transcriptional regulator [Lachnospiraceae bacterium]|jgi:GntR family transcriptional regulator|nr:GntR family transcriptional regulator [Lachnospiraceae bacterium]